MLNPFGNSGLGFYSTEDSFDGADEFKECSIAHGLDHASPMPGGGWFNDFG